MSITFVKCAMRINSAAILRVKIVWSRGTDAYKMAATIVLVQKLMQVICRCG